ncbi:oxidoreductase [Streptomyces acidiscabies]|uniref:oxidoreductase n=1 Tax=Streptomyces acidiscabies TaxID=42234 RepID=UPI0030D0A5F1
MLAGTLTPADGLTLTRMGYGAMQLAGPGVFGPPKDPRTVIAVLRAVVDAGVTHIDTADFYGPTVVNELIRKALHPYPRELRIVTKVGCRRGPDGSWHPGLDPDDLRAQVHENLEHLGVEALDAVNLRAGTVDGPDDASIGEAFSALAELREQGLIRHLGLSTVTSAQLSEAQAIAPVVTVQNHYNLAHREDDALVERCAAEGIAYVPYFPLGGFSPIQSQVLTDVAGRLQASPQQVALAWLLGRSPAIAVIPGTSSLGHLRENLAAVEVELPKEVVVELDGIGGGRA